MSIRWFKGYVNCKITGKHIELFINLVLKNNIKIWNVYVVSLNMAKFSVSIKDYFKLKPLLKKSNMRIHIVNKQGLPFWFKKLRNRLGIIFSIIFFLILIYLSSSVIWFIDIAGNKKIEEEIIYQALNEIGVKKATLKIKLPSNEVIKEQLQGRLEDVSWVGVKIKGTRLEITIVEKVVPEEKANLLPSNIISAKDAVIYKILAEKGIPQVKVNDRVKKGDILISGVLGNEERSQNVTSQGLVQGIVWYKSIISIHLNQSWREFTGNCYEQKYFVLGNRMIKIKGYDIISFEQYHIKEEFKQVYFRDNKLPIGILTVENLEYTIKQKTLPEFLAYSNAIEQAKKNLFSKIATNSKIISEKTISKKTENDILTLNILYEVVEDIAEIQLITQGE